MRYTKQTHTRTHYRPDGWSAHIIEEKFAEAAPKPMLYRPKAVYVGKYAGPQGSKYIPIEKRTKK